MYTIGDYVKVTNSNITGKIVNIKKGQFLAPQQIYNNTCK